MEGPRRGIYAICVLAVIAHGLLLWWSNAGPRGSDQFWYLADVETLVRGGPPISTTHFPAPLLRDPDSPVLRFFAHNTLVLHAVKPLATVFGAHNGWLLLNWLSTLGAAGLVLATVRRFVGDGWGALSFAAYLLMPISFWQSANTLQESAFGLISALLTYGLVTTRSSLRRYVLFSAIATVAILCNPIYLIVAIGFPLVALWECRARRPAIILYALIGLTAAAYVYTNKLSWLPESFQPGLRAIIVNSVPGMSNMEWFHRVEPHPVTAELLWRKIRAAFVVQAPTSRQAVFYLPVQLTVLFAIGLAHLTARDRGGKRLLLGAVVLFSLYWVVAFLHVNQARYAMFFLPAVLAAAVVGLGRAVSSSVARRIVPTLCVFALLGMVGVDVVLARHIRGSGIDTATAMRDIETALDDLGADVPVIIEAPTSRCLMIAYALRPRPCLFLLVGYLSDDQLRTVTDRFGAQAVICSGHSTLPQVLDLPGAERPLSSTFPDLYLHRSGTGSSQR